MVVAYGDGFPLVGGASLANEAQQHHSGVAQLVAGRVGVPGDGRSDLLGRVGKLGQAASG